MRRILVRRVESQHQLETLFEAAVDAADVVNLAIHDRGDLGSVAHQGQTEIVSLIVDLPCQAVYFLHYEPGTGPDLTGLYEPDELPERSLADLSAPECADAETAHIGFM